MVSNCKRVRREGKECEKMNAYKISCREPKANLRDNGVKETIIIIKLC
jgi:hypothetical protein